METKANNTEVTAVEAPRTSFFDRMSVYGVEFAVAMVTMIVLATVVSVSLYAMFSLARDIYGSDAGYGALWAAASAIVWLPVLFIFYARARGYMQRHPEIHNNPVQRGFVVAYQVVMLCAVVGFAFAAIYSFFMALVNTNDVVGPLVEVTLPSILSAGVFAGAYIGFFRHPIVARRLYLVALSVITAVVIIPTIVLSVISIRHSNSVTPHWHTMYQQNQNDQNYNDNYNYNYNSYQ